MGYTHYWYRELELDKDKFTAFVADCRKLAETLPIPLGNGCGEGKPVFADDLVSFNGVGDDSCESLLIAPSFESRTSQKPENNKWFSFCKTRGLPYDLVVQCCLIALKEHFGNAVTIRSDGDAGEWKEAANSCQTILGYGLTFEPDSD